MVSELDRVFGN